MELRGYWNAEIQLEDVDKNFLVLKVLAIFFFSSGKLMIFCFLWEREARVIFKPWSAIVYIFK